MEAVTNCFCLGPAPGQAAACQSGNPRDRSSTENPLVPSHCKIPAADALCCSIRFNGPPTICLLICNCMGALQGGGRRRSGGGGGCCSSGAGPRGCCRQGEPPGRPQSRGLHADCPAAGGRKHHGARQAWCCVPAGMQHSLLRRLNPGVRQDYAGCTAACMCPAAWAAHAHRLALLSQYKRDHWPNT